MARRGRSMVAGTIALAHIWSCGGQMDERNGTETVSSNSAGGREGSAVSSAGMAVESPAGSGGAPLAVGGSIEWTEDPPPRQKCGNGILDIPEQCDDANNTDGDGCSSVCLVEFGWDCTRVGVRCRSVSICGNGVIEGAELCDDGNRDGSDGCAADCMEIASGWRCSPVAYGGCQPICGEGQLASEETCDDANCTSDCLSAPHCGNGLVEPAESCDPGLSIPTPYGKGGCTGACRPAPYCGDGNVDAHFDEDCDPPLTRYGGFTCNESCVLTWTQ